MPDIKNKYCSGSSAVEMSYIIPFFLFIFILIIHAVFFCHDKAVLNGAAAETAVVCAQYSRKKGEEYDMENFFRKRLGDKLIYAEDVSFDIVKTENMVTVSAAAETAIMKINVCQKAVIAEPEHKIRWVR